MAIVSTESHVPDWVHTKANEGYPQPSPPAYQGQPGAYPPHSGGVPFPQSTHSGGAPAPQGFQGYPGSAGYPGPQAYPEGPASGAFTGGPAPQAVPPGQPVYSYPAHPGAYILLHIKLLRPNRPSTRGQAAAFPHGSCASTRILSPAPSAIRQA